MWLAPVAFLAIIALQGLHVTLADDSDTAVIAGGEEIQKDGSITESVDEPKTGDLNEVHSDKEKNVSPLTSSKVEDVEKLDETTQSLQPPKDRSKRNSKSSESSGSSDESSNEDKNKKKHNKKNVYLTGGKTIGYNRITMSKTTSSNAKGHFSESSDSEKSSEENNYRHKLWRRDTSSDESSNSEDKNTVSNHKLSSSFKKVAKHFSDNSEYDSNSSDERNGSKDSKSSNESDDDDSGKKKPHRMPHHPPPQFWQGPQRGYGHPTYNRLMNNRVLRDASDETSEEDYEVTKITVKETSADSGDSESSEEDKEKKFRFEHRPPPPGFYKLNGPPHRLPRDASKEESDENEKKTTVTIKLTEEHLKDSGDSESDKSSSDDYSKIKFGSSSESSDENKKKHRPPPHSYSNEWRAPKHRPRRDSSSSDDKSYSSTFIEEYDSDESKDVKLSYGQRTSTKQFFDKTGKNVEQKTLVIVEQDKCLKNKCSENKKYDQKTTEKEGKGVMGKFITNIGETFKNSNSDESKSSHEEGFFSKIKNSFKHSN